MTKIPFIPALLVALLVCLLPIAPAQAQVNRTFVSAAGSDSNNCANVTTPCRHFAAAYAATAPSGEIFVLDPANYGSLTITHAVSIEGHGWASIAPPNGGNAITINANPGDSIGIHGVSINGTGATGGTNGIVFNSGGSLTVTNCVMQDFVTNGSFNTGNGILIQPASGTLTFTISNTTASNNNGTGIFYFPPSGSPSAIGIIDHVMTNVNNTNGMSFNTQNTGGGTTIVSVSNSTASKSQADGIVAQNSASSTIKLSIDNVIASGNTDGINVTGTVQMLLGRSVITGNNNIGVANTTSPNTAYSYGDNRINLNGTDISGTTLNTTFKPQ